MLIHTRKGTSIGYKRNPTTDEQFISKALLCSILLLSRKHLQLFAMGSSHFEPSQLKKVLRPIFIWQGTCREFVTRLTVSQPKKLAPLAKKFVKLDFAVVSMGFSEALSSFSHFLDCSRSPCRSLLISKPTLCKTILSSSFVLESRTKTDKLFFLLWRHSLPKSREKQ